MLTKLFFFLAILGTEMETKKNHAYD
jgi:hypothetical protein